MVCRCALIVAFVFALAFAVTVPAIAGPTAPAGSPPVLSPDPYFGNSGLQSHAIPVTFCPCQGNCCFGQPNGTVCGLPHVNCFCSAGFCVKGGGPGVR